MSPEITNHYRRQDPDGTRRRHDFWRNVIAPHVSDDRSSGRLPRCLEPGVSLGD